jgi:hypothetical protein
MHSQRSITKTGVDIVRQEFTVAENSIVNIFLNSMDGNEETQFDTRTHKSALIFANFTECYPGNNIRYNKYGEGSETVYLSAAGIIRNLHCHIYLTALEEKNEKFTLVIDATKEVPLIFEIIGNRIEVTDPADTHYRMVVHLTNVPTVKILMSRLSRAYLLVKDSAQKVDYYIDYPDQYFDNQVAIFCKTSFFSNFAIRGMVNVRFTPSWYQCTGETENHALSGIKGTVAVLGTNDRKMPVPVYMDSGQNFDVEFYANSSCVIPTINRKPAKYLFPWNDRMTKYLTEFGIPPDSFCEFVYANRQVNLTIISRDGNDVFRGNQSTLYSIDVHLGIGRAWIEWNETYTPSRFTVDGKEMAQVIMVAPVNETTVVLNGTEIGEDNAIAIYSKYYYPETVLDGDFIVLKYLCEHTTCIGRFLTKKGDTFKIVHGKVPT